MVGFKTTVILDPYGIHNVEPLFWPFTFLFQSFIIPKLRKHFLGQLMKPIHYSAKFGCSKICKFILERTLIPFNPKDNEGWTPLHLAAENGHSTTYKLIMEKLEIKNPRKRNGAKETPLHIAAGRVSFLKMSKKQTSFSKE